MTQQLNSDCPLLSFSLIHIRMSFTLSCIIFLSLAFFRSLSFPLTLSLTLSHTVVLSSLAVIKGSHTNVHKVRYFDKSHNDVILRIAQGHTNRRPTQKDRRKQDEDKGEKNKVLIRMRRVTQKRNKEKVSRSVAVKK